MAIRFADRVRVSTSTTGTGALNLGAALTGYRTFAQAVTDGALSSGSTIYYGIQDGNNWECGTGVYTAGSPDTLTRTVNSSSAGGTTAISLSGTANVSLTLTQLSAVTATLTSGTIDGVVIGGSTPANGTFTGLTATGGVVSLTNATSNYLLWGTSGSGAPTSGTRSLGTKLVLDPNVPTDYDTALGVNSSTLWSTVPTGGVYTYHIGVNTMFSVSEAGAALGYDTSVGSNNILAYTIDGASGSYRVLQLETAGLPCWQIGANNTAASGSNTGSDFYINAFDDTGTFNHNPITISRASGQVVVNTTLSFGNQVGALLYLYSPTYGMGIAGFDMQFWTGGGAQGATPSGFTFRSNAYNGTVFGYIDMNGFNGQVGGSAPNTGAFTTLSASGTVSGTGFSNYLASPPAIGGTTASTGRFSTLTATGAVTFTSGTIDGMSVGATTASTGRFTTLSCTGYFIETVAAAISAAGTTLATATALATQNNIITTTASGSGVKLPSVTVGTIIAVGNFGANALLVYPVSGQTINALAASAGYSLAVNTVAQFLYAISNKWYVISAS